MSERAKMVCPDCGVEMNRHAEKINYTAGLSEPQPADARTGGVLEEFHTCPNCGRTHARPAGEGADV